MKVAYSQVFRGIFEYDMESGEHRVLASFKDFGPIESFSRCLGGWVLASNEYIRIVDDEWKPVRHWKVADRGPVFHDTWTHGVRSYGEYIFAVVSGREWILVYDMQGTLLQKIEAKEIVPEPEPVVTMANEIYHTNHIEPVTDQIALVSFGNLGVVSLVDLGRKEVFGDFRFAGQCHHPCPTHEPPFLISIGNNHFKQPGGFHICNRDEVHLLHKAKFPRGITKAGEHEYFMVDTRLNRVFLCRIDWIDDTPDHKITKLFDVDTGWADMAWVYECHPLDGDHISTEKLEHLRALGYLA